MHMLAVVLLKPEDATPEGLDKAMAPHEECWPDDDGPKVGFWDWWRVGGRWDGKVCGLDGYDECPTCGPAKAVSKYETSSTLACHYSGHHEQWGHNAIPVAQMGEVRPYTVVTPDGQAHHRESWNGQEWVTDERWDETSGRLFLAHRGCIAVGVDYHS